MSSGWWGCVASEWTDACAGMEVGRAVVGRIVVGGRVVGGRVVGGIVVGGIVVGGIVTTGATVMEKILLPTCPVPSVGPWLVHTV